jgi:hypothetical protein
MSQIPLRSVRLNARPATTLQSFVGTAGEIFYDSTNQTLRVYPGNTAGGKILADRDWVNSAIGDIGSSSLVNGSRTVSLSSTGSLTIPGDIRSEGNINVDINLSDSTLQRWSFGEDGALTFPDGTSQTTAYTGGTIFTNLIDSLDSSAITVTPAAIFSSNLSVGGDITLPNGAIIRDSVDNALAIGFNAGNITAQNHAIAIGTDAGSAGQGYEAIAIGQGAGGGLDLGFQGQEAIAIGSGAGSDSQGVYSIAIGSVAGQLAQSSFAVAIGYAAGQQSQSAGTVAIGQTAGNNSQGTNAIAVGFGAGSNTQGANAVAIGTYAGGTNQAANSIILNATGATLDQTTANTFTVAPIRNASGTSGFLQYNSTTKEVTYSSDIRSETGFYIDINLADSTLYRWQFGEDGQLTFPDGGNLRVSGIPASSIGLAGDTAGMLAFNASYAYYCTASYDGVTNIWRRTAHDVATW